MTAEPLFQTGKAALAPGFTEAVNRAFERHELLKVSMFQNCLEDPREMAARLTARTKSEVVQAIGKEIVPYRQAKREEHRKIVLPRDWMAMRQIAIPGGTFDSIRNGRLKLAEEAYSHFLLDTC